MPTIFEKDAAEQLCPYNDFKPCFGAKCMAWSWVGPRQDHCTTDNLVETEDGPRPIGVPPAPAGEGWAMEGEPGEKGYSRSKKDGLPPAATQYWVRPRVTVRGQCARNVGDNEYGGF